MSTGLPSGMFSRPTSPLKLYSIRLLDVNLHTPSVCNSDSGGEGRKDQRGEDGNGDSELAKVVTIELARRQDQPWATVWRDADGADQMALTLPVGRVIFLFEPI